MDNQIQLADVIFVDNEYSLKHPHMIHRHENFLELLYIAEESGRYIVGDYEYAVTAGDFVVCNANVPHGEDPFQEHCIQTYCLELAVANLSKHLTPEHCAKISAAVSGENHPFFGKHHTAQTRAKLATANIGKHHTTQTRSKMSVSHRSKSLFKNLLSELDKKQMTYSALAKLFGLSVASVSAKITGKVRFTDKEKVKLEEIFCKPADYLLKLEE